MGLGETIGRALGGLISPLIAEGSLLRGKRLFHPDGVVYTADVRPLVAEGDTGELALRLAGPALVRLSGGVWPYRGGRSEAMPDILGAAVRFRSSEEVTAAPGADDQDLLFLTTRSLLLLPIAMLTTDRRDFLANEYHGVWPFEVAGLGRVELRLVPLRAARSPEGNRRQKLDRAAAAGLAVLRLEVRKVGRRGSWRPLVDIALRERAAIDQEALSFDPFRTGRGIVPSGLLQATRLAVYPASFLGRMLANRGRK